MQATKERTELIQATSEAFREVMPGVSKAALWGNPEEQHGSITRFKAGFTTPLHTHTHDVRMVIISGTMVHGDADGQKTPLGPGAYCYVPGGTRHTSACTIEAECVFYEEQPGKFDLKTFPDHN